MLLVQSDRILTKRNRPVLGVKKLEAWFGVPVGHCSCRPSVAVVRNDDEDGD